MNMIKQGIAGILCCAQLGLGAVVFEEPFDGLADGTLNGKNGWLASPSGDVLVQGDVTHDGSAKAVSLANSGGEGSASAMQQDVAQGTAPNVVWSELHARPVLMSVVPPVPSDATTAFYVNTASNMVVFDGTDEVALTSRPSIQSNEWVHFETAANYGNKTWALWIDGVAMAAGLDFYNSGNTKFSTFGVWEGDSDQASYLDAVSIVTTKGLVSVVR